MSQHRAKLERKAADAAHKRFPQEDHGANRYGFIEGYIAAVEGGVSLSDFVQKSGDERGDKMQRLKNIEQAAWELMENSPIDDHDLPYISDVASTEFNSLRLALGFNQ